MSDIKEEKKKYKLTMISEIMFESYYTLMSFLWSIKGSEVMRDLDIEKLNKEKICEFKPCMHDNYKTTVILKDSEDN